MVQEKETICALLTEVMTGQSPVQQAFSNWPSPETIVCELYDEIWHTMSHFVEDEDIWTKDSEYLEYYMQKFRSYLLRLQG